MLPRDALFSGDWPQGFSPAGTPAADAALAACAQAATVLPREQAEGDPGWKQPIPYCTIVRQGLCFCVERLPRQGETRLHGRLSVGLGGHIAEEDLGGADPVRTALHRELAEEVSLPPGTSASHFLGLVNDDGDEVGRVHFGLVFGVVIPAEGSVRVLESLKMRGDFRHLVGPDGLWQDLHRFETWSRILLEARALEALATHAPRRRGKSCGKTQEEP